MILGFIVLWYISPFLTFILIPDFYVDYFINIAPSTPLHSEISPVVNWYISSPESSSNLLSSPRVNWYISSQESVSNLLASPTSSDRSYITYSEVPIDPKNYQYIRIAHKLLKLSKSQSLPSTFLKLPAPPLITRHLKKHPF